MKKILPFLLLAAVVTSCSHEPNTQEEVVTPAVKMDTLWIGKKVYNMQDLADTNIVFSQIERYIETDSSALANNNNARRNGDTLILKCENKDVVLVNKSNEDDSYRGYRFLDYNKEIDHYVVHCSYYEGSNVLLVNKKNGEQMEVLGVPAVSPGKKYFACGNCDLIAQYDVSGLELYEFQQQVGTRKNGMEK
jgi:hypothetical protein